MNNALSKILNILKYFLLIIAFAITFIGMILMYDRLMKPLTDAIPSLLPFLLVLISFVITLFIGRKEISTNLLFNFGCVLILSIIIVIGLRAKFDTNMIIYHKYGISFNSAYFADNLAMIQSMLYLIFVSNVLYIIASIKRKDVVSPAAIEPTIEEIANVVNPTPAMVDEIAVVADDPIVQDEIIVVPQQNVVPQVEVSPTQEVPTDFIQEEINSSEDNNTNEIL